VTNLSGQKCRNKAPKNVKISILAINIPPRGDSFAVFLRNFHICTRLAFKFLVWSLSGDTQQRYKHFPAVGALSQKFTIAFSGEITDRIKKVRKVQKWYGPPLSPCQVWWGSWVAKKCNVLFVCLFVLLVTLCNDKVFDNGNAVKRCTFQNNYSVIA